MFFSYFFLGEGGGGVLYAFHLTRTRFLLDESVPVHPVVPLVCLFRVLDNSGQIIDLFRTPLHMLYASLTEKRPKEDFAVCGADAFVSSNGIRRVNIVKSLKSGIPVYVSVFEPELSSTEWVYLCARGLRMHKVG